MRTNTGDHVRSDAFGGLRRRAAPDTLDIYVTDVEGGNATLFVTLPASRF